MKEKRGDLDDETADALDRHVTEFVNLAIQRAETFDSLFAKYVFATNAGGAAALLTYLGAVADKGSPLGSSAALALSAFTVGLILAGVGCFASAKLWLSYHGALLEKRNNWVVGKISVAELSELRVTTAWKPIANWSGLISFALFVVGAIAGLFPLLWPIVRQIT